MADNFTPLTVAETQKKPIEQEKSVPSKQSSFDFNVIFLSLIVVTLAVLVILLFFLIQKKMQELSLIPFYFA